MCPKLICWCSTWPTAGVCEEAIPQGHSEQPRLDAQLLPRLGVWTAGAAQSHQRTAVPCRSQWQHEWHQHPSRKGELRAGQKHTNVVFRFRHVYCPNSILSIPPCFHRTPWWWHWRASLLALCSTLWASAPPSSLCSPQASSALMLALPVTLLIGLSLKKSNVIFN